MSILINGYSFDGPYSSTYSLEDRSGVYVILCNSRLIDVGESAGVRNRIENHDRKDCWERNCSGNISFAVHYTPNLQQSGRMEIEQEIRRSHRDIPCGEV